MKASRLIASLSMAFLAYLLSIEIMRAFVDLYGAKTFGLFIYFNAIIGFLVGWLILGRMNARSPALGILGGLISVVAMCFWAMLILLIFESFRRMFTGRLTDARIALNNFFEVATEWSMVFLDDRVITTAVIGGIIGGLLTTMSSRKWR